MRIVQPVYTHQGQHGYVVSMDTGHLVGFVRHDAMMPPLRQVIGPHVLLDSLNVPVGEFRRLCLMPGVTYDADR